MSRKNKKPQLSPQQTLERFVWRARRVEEHSLVKNGDAERYAERCETYSLTNEGVTLAGDNVPADEEAIESLAGRLRPFIVQREPIYLPKVIASLDSLVPPASRTREENEDLASIKTWFDERSVNKDKGMYTIQVFDKDGAPWSERMSDSLLAESWLYTDYVHADPQGDKAEGLKVDYLQRYRAASPYFCEFALQVLRLLDIVRGLVGKGVLQLSEYALRSPVTYSAALAAAKEKIVSGSMYILPSEAGSPSSADLESVPGAIDMASLLPDKAPSSGKARLAVFDADNKRIGLYAARYEASDKYITIVVAEVLSMRVRASLGFRGRAVKAPFSVQALEGADDRAPIIAESLRYPNYAELIYTEDGQQHRLRMQTMNGATSV